MRIIPNERGEYTTNARRIPTAALYATAKKDGRRFVIPLPSPLPYPHGQAFLDNLERNLERAGYYYVMIVTGKPHARKGYWVLDWKPFSDGEKLRGMLLKSQTLLVTIHNGWVFQYPRLFLPGENGDLIDITRLFRDVCFPHEYVLYHEQIKIPKDSLGLPKTAEYEDFVERIIEILHKKINSQLFEAGNIKVLYIPTKKPRRKNRV